MDLPKFSINKRSDIWEKLFQIKPIDKLIFDGKGSVCDMVMPTSDGREKYTFCENNVVNIPNAILYYSDKIVIIARIVPVCGKKVLMYYVELDPKFDFSINEFSNESTAMENYVINKHKLSTFSLFNAANLDIPLTSQQIHLEQMEKQSSNTRLIYQVVNVNNQERLLFQPRESEFHQAVTPIVMLLETTYGGKYKVTTQLDDALKILNSKINHFCNK